MGEGMGKTMSYAFIDTVGCYCIWQSCAVTFIILILMKEKEDKDFLMFMYGPRHFQKDLF